jgi:uncharacterized protein with FMN-binding domain
MPKRGAAALAITIIALVLLLNFKTPDGAGAILAGSSRANSSIAASPAAASSNAGTGSAAGATAAATPPSSGTASIDGSVVATRYGDVQVEIQLSGGKLSDVIALALPSGRRSSSISSAAAPLLRSEALKAQSATIDIVSGATYTSQAYAQSLQAALDQAGL